ncbi:MAG: viroplasmin family protein [Clostridium saudiense]|uniref:ribonuclease H1 domain-containing protein n=1 Tax=Clostridium saudiense TaxID=1414720 RepID=UPI003991DFB1
MAKQQKYYAIKTGKGVKDKIVTTWSECEQLVKGYPSVYKSFKTEEEAKLYLGSIKDVDKKLEENNKAMEYNKAKKKGTVSVANVFKGVRIDKVIAEEFEAKCKDLNISKEKILNELIKEWVD